VADGRTVLIAVTDDKPFDIVRDAVAELGLPLVRLEQRRQSLEDLFRDAPPVAWASGGAAAASAGPTTATAPGSGVASGHGGAS